MGGFGGRSLILFSPPCFGSTKFQLLISSLKETEAGNVAPDRPRVRDTDHEFMYTKTDASNYTHKHKPALTHTLVISGFLAPVCSLLASRLRKKMMNVAEC